MNKNGFTKEEWKIVEKTIYENMLEEKKSWNPPKGSVIPDFENEIRKLGFEFELSIQVEEICTQNPGLTKDIILKYYKKAIDNNEKSYLMSCLISPHNKDLIPFFLKEFYIDKKEYSFLRDMIANCLEKTADTKYLDDYLNILNDETLPIGRNSILWTLDKLRTPIIKEELIKQFNKKNVDIKMILDSLRKYKDSTLLPYFVKYKDDKNTDIRSAAKKGIKSIEKKLSKINKQ